MKKIYIILILVAGALLSSCTKENPTTERESHRGVTIKITPSASATTTTRAVGIPEEGTEAENKIENLKIFMADDPYNGTIQRVYDFDPSKNQSFDNADRWNAATQSLEINKPNYQLLAIYAVANWHPANMSDYAVGKSAGNIPLAFTFYESELASPFVMYSKASPPADLFTSSGAQLDIQLIRQPIKVEITVKLDEAFAKAYPDVLFGEPSGVKSQMGVLATPNFARFFDPGGASYPESFKMISIPYKEMTRNSAGFDKVTFYLCPNMEIYDRLTHATKFALRLPYIKTGSDVAIDNYYTIVLKLDTPNTFYYASHNTIYRLTATILGFGSTTPIDLDKKVNVAVEALPWTDGGYDDEIGGAKLGVNRSEINIRGGVTNTQLEVTSDDLSKVTFTDIDSKLSISAMDLNTGAVSVNTVTPIGLYTSNYATFKVKRGNLSKTITVHAGLWATGNIVYKKRNADPANNVGDYINSDNPFADGLYFFYGSNRGLQYGNTNGSSWSATSKYYYWEGLTKAFGEYTGKADWNDPWFHSDGDPCKAIAPEHTWRLPNEADFNSLNQNKGAKDDTHKGQYFYNNTVFLRWAGAAVNGKMNFYNTNGLYWAKDGDKHARIESYSSESEINLSYGVQTHDNFSVRCVHN